MEQYIKAALFDGLMNNEQMQKEYPQILEAIQNAYNEICFKYTFEKTILQ